MRMFTQFVSVHNYSMMHRPFEAFSLLKQSSGGVFSTYFFPEAVKHGLGACSLLLILLIPAGWSPKSDCAPPKFPLVSFVYGDQAVSVGEANAGLSSLRSASQPSAVLPQPQNAELSAPTAEILVNSKTKPHSLGRDALCPPEFRFFSPRLNNFVSAEVFFF